MGIFVVMVGVFLLAGIIGTKNNSIASKGKQGEKLVNKFLSGKKDGLLISNLIIKENNIYTQIDHVYITDNAIFVIETKHHSGIIYGSAENLKWTTVYGSRKFSMYNPLKQNDTHVKRLRKVLGDNTVKIIPITIFSNTKCTLKNDIIGVYPIQSFIFNYNSIIKVGTAKINKLDYFNKIKKLNLSTSYYHKKQQIKFAKVQQKNKK